MSVLVESIQLFILISQLLIFMEHQNCLDFSISIFRELESFEL